MPTSPIAPELRFAFELDVEVGTPLDLGQTQAGHRRIVPIAGGVVSGPRLEGRVLPVGADWQILRPDGTADLDARYTIQTGDGALIYVVNRGVRHGPPEVLARLNRGERVDPGSYYFRSAASFETGAPQYSWLTRAIIVATGERYPDKVAIRFWELL
ncbi:MAG TPA: DUF3237 domain-containing protein [Bryobacteraceae bacterium]|nr:DUF3237 domain-containing protein [Bryobacteraceae bacterium]